jgi:hypothetical protein
LRGFDLAAGFGFRGCGGRARCSQSRATASSTAGLPISNRALHTRKYLRVRAASLSGKGSAWRVIRFFMGVFYDW